MLKYIVYPVIISALIAFSFSVLSRQLHQRSQIIATATTRMKVIPVPALSDNYMYLVIDESSRHAFVVDPVEPQKLIDTAHKENATITHALTTHHHHDHAGGNKELASSVKDIQIFGGDDRIPALTKKVTDGDTIQVGNINVNVFFTPCHTTGHVLYLAKQGNEVGSLFTGDTLFVGGCGRFFEGTAEQMHHALNEVIAGLPDETKVYCGHEYTKKNLEFAVHVEPTNQIAKEKLDWATERAKSGIPTVPSTVGEEKTFNPFMRVQIPEFVKSLKLSENNAIAAMAHLRELKNKF